MASIELDSLKKPLWLLIQHGIASSSPITSEVDRIQNRKSAADAKHTANEVAHEQAG